MSTRRSERQAREGERNQRLRIATVVAVITGVVLLAFISFRFSYAGIHRIVLAAGVSPGEARVYPLILDGMLVITCMAGLTLHRAEWWMRGYAGLMVLILLTIIAVLDTLHAVGIGLPHRPAAAMMALIPWVLLLLGLGLFLVVLRDLRAAVRGLNTPLRHGSQNGLGAAKATLAHEAHGLDILDRRVPPAEPRSGVNDAGSADFDDPDEPAIRLLPPGPKPGADPAGPGHSPLVATATPDGEHGSAHAMRL